MQSLKLSSRANTELDRLLQNAVERRDLPMATAVVANRESILYRGAVGSSPTDLYRIASMTKPVTSVGIMMLQERGLLALDDQVGHYLPAFAERPVIDQFNLADGSLTIRSATQPMTIRHLLAHTSGLGYDFCNKTLFALCKDGKYSDRTAPLLHDPGNRWTYGHSTAILGEIIECITGQPLHHFLETEILQPLGMFDTGYFLKPTDVHRLAPLYHRVNGELVKDSTTELFRPQPFGDGGLIGTADDYIPFLQMLLNLGQWRDRRLLTSQSVTAMISNQIGDLAVEQQRSARPALSCTFPLGAGEDKFGLGFQLKMGIQNGGRWAGSYSWAGIFNTHFWADPQKGIAAVLFTQLLPFCDDTFMGVLADFERCIYRNLV